MIRVAAIALLVSGGCTSAAKRDSYAEIESEATGNFAAIDPNGKSPDHRRDCEAGASDACSRFGLQLVMAGQHEEGVRILTTTCDRGELLACSNLGALFAQGKGVEQDVARSTELYRQACKNGEVGGSPVGCSNLGTAYRLGRGVLQDPVEAARLYAISCEGKSDLGCTNLGVMYEKGLGVAADLAAARRHYEAACRLGAATACSNLAALLHKGEGGPQDEVASERLLRLACKLGHKASCTRVGVSAGP